MAQIDHDNGLSYMTDLWHLFFLKANGRGGQEVKKKNQKETVVTILFFL